MKTTIYNSVRVVAALPVAAYTATTNGATVDRLGTWAENYQSIGVAVHVGTVTNGTHAIAVEESDDGSSWAAAPAGSIVGGAISVTSSAGGATAYQLEYKGAKRYVRVSTTVTGSPATGGVYGAMFLLGDASTIPLAR